MDGTEVTVAILAGPITAGLVAAIGISEQRRAARDLEARRNKLVSSAHDQLAAVQIWESIKGANGSDSPEFSKKAESIISTALESLLQAQSMHQPQMVRERNKVGDMWLIGSIESTGGRVLRNLYYIAFAWTISLFALGVLAAGMPPYEDVLGILLSFLVIIVATGLVPALVLRWAALSYDRHRKPASSNRSGERGGQPRTPMQPPPSVHQRPPSGPAGWYPPPMPNPGGVRHGNR
ncbi:DUF2975 domain-containing protein [Nocardia gamkensis]|uniref:DUF2975 domain-containing protein n=1 Tax=Nocardia gamkensis TaxID=352869 RepID=A0A7X6L8U8_9NOCA|nr:DUF2975 domain-containing protein [Nocardia gamkensis]NKY30003.1 DUF2975 domain-containing protein [Nocardia gamkensis]NQE68759.1 hypothetical protein [Nocardia gamkensis]